MAHQAQPGSQDKDHDEVVQQAGTAHDDAQTVYGHEEAGRQRDGQVVEEAQSHTAEQQDGDGADQGSSRSPGEGVAGSTEELETQGDAPLAHRRVNHVFGLGQPAAGVSLGEDLVDG